jgi:hypothetical protein
VEAFLAVVAELGLVPERTSADQDALAAAAAACHPTERRPASASEERPTPASKR